MNTQQPQTPAPATPGEPAPQKTILIVEDVPVTLHLSTLALQTAGYHVLEARDASAAQRIARSGAALDLLITDYLMPDMDGIELAQWFQHFAPRLKIVLVSATPDNASFAATFLPTVRCYTKPDVPEDLVAIAKSALDDAA